MHKYQRKEKYIYHKNESNQNQKTKKQDSKTAIDTVTVKLNQELINPDVLQELVKPSTMEAPVQRISLSAKSQRARTELRTERRA